MSHTRVRTCFRSLCRAAAQGKRSSDGEENRSLTVAARITHPLLKHVLREAFTLIEVLVVVAIIALLIAILLPSLVRVRNEMQASVCASNMKQGLTGVFLHQAEVNVRKDEWSTNFGWAIYSLKQNKGQLELFTCPSDPAPRPAPAVRDRLHFSVNEPPFGTTTGDAIFTRVMRSGGGWLADIEDQVDADETGGDSYNDSNGDLVFRYSATKGQDFVMAEITKIPGTAYRHDLITYKGEMIQDNLTGTITIGIPLIWMSYGANASAGLRKVKGTSLLIAEAGKMGLFAEKLGNYPSDNLGWALRFRHGERIRNKPDLTNAPDWTAERAWSNQPPKTGRSRLPYPYQDADYVPATRLNAGFMDGHVERMGYWELMDLDRRTPMPMDRPLPKFNVWFGAREASSVSYGP